MPLPSRSFMESYVTHRKHLIRVICRTNQWSGVNEARIWNWLRNFQDIEGKYIGMKLFLNSLYYSESNMVKLLENGVNEQIISHEIRERQIVDKNPYVTKSILNSKVENELAKTLFIPLSDNNNPSESGLVLTRYLTNDLHVSEKNIFFNFQINEDLIRQFNRIIILDDCIATGNQLKDFWNGVNGSFGLKKIVSSHDIPTYFLGLVGYEKSIIDLQIDGYTEGLRVKINQVLNESHRILQPNHKAWRDYEEWTFVINYLKSLCETKGLSMFGYYEFDFAVFLHNTAPDWTLPIFWQSIDGEWVNLVNRKNNIMK
jgi:hypothetical protein